MLKCHSLPRQWESLSLVCITPEQGNNYLLSYKLFPSAWLISLISIESVMTLEWQLLVACLGLAQTGCHCTPVRNSQSCAECGSEKPGWTPDICQHHVCLHTGWLSDWDIELATSMGHKGLHADPHDGDWEVSRSKSPGYPCAKAWLAAENLRTSAHGMVGWRGRSKMQENKLRHWY